jgi:hypothetical protein
MPASSACLVAGDPVRSVVYWRPSAAANRPRRRPVVSGDVVAANAVTASPASLMLADVICCGNVAALSGILDRYPGCAVATAPAPGDGVRIVTRTCRPLTVSCRGTAPGSGALACAIFVHAWLAAGQPLPALRPARLEAVAPYAATLIPPVPVPFVLYC